MKQFLITLVLAASAGTAYSCSCMGNDSYCTTVSPDRFSNPASTALVVKLSDVHYGITVKVLQTFDGTTLPDDTLTVWGDNGGLCRIYLNGIPTGDTLVFGMDPTDLSGNSMWNPDYPPNLEAEGDYMVSVCGVHALDYAAGQVIGWITGPTTETMSVAEFTEVIMGCAGVTAVEEHLPDPLIIRYVHGVPQLEMPPGTGAMQLIVQDIQGRCVLSRTWDGIPVPLAGLPAGTYIAEARTAQARWSKKVVVH